ncbi:MAG: HAD-IB family phosphatase [Candidatus Aminicenantales bacterium]|jgi:HAD superfamily hydrolase (TIGR01490 family)
MEAQRLAIIDLDGTLLRRTSSEHSFFRFIVLRGKVGPLCLASFLLTFFRDALKLGLRQAIGWNATYLRGKTPETVRAWARRYGRAYLREAVPEGLQARIRRFKDEGCLIVLLSGSLQVLVSELQEKLGADIVIGRELEVVGGKLTGHRSGIYPYARQKVEALFQKVIPAEVDWKGCWALADRLSDLPVLDLVGHPVAVHPTAGLRRHAQQHGWEIID